MESYLSDPSLHYLANVARVRMSATAPISTKLAPTELSATDVLLGSPPVVVRLVGHSADAIRAARTLLELVTWSGNNTAASWLVVAGWCGLCLLTSWTARYALNAAVLAFLALRYFTPTSLPRPNSALTPQTYTALLHDIDIITLHLATLNRSLLAPLLHHFSFAPTPNRSPPAYTTARLALTSYPLYLLLTYFVQLNHLLLFLGLTALLWNAPFFRTLRVLLYKSAAIRWIGRIILATLLGGKGLQKELDQTKKGLGIPGLFGRKKGGAVVTEQNVKVVGTTGVRESSPGRQEEGEDVQLQFAVFENQRWWVGLDWTHALLPGERPSWTDIALNPSSPPSSFVLPPPTITYTPSPTKANPGSKLKKITEWKWLDPEWSVLRSSVPLPRPTDPRSPLSFPFPAAPSSPTKSNTIPPSPPNDPYAPTLPSTTTSTIVPTYDPTRSAELVSMTNWMVDQEGWQYGDNHFEKMGPKGGLGKYTRRRAWVRKAGLVERCERVDDASTVGSGSGRRERESSTTRVVSGAEKDGGGASLRSRTKSSEGRSKREKEKESGSTSAVKI